MQNGANQSKMEQNITKRNRGKQNQAKLTRISQNSGKDQKRKPTNKGNCIKTQQNEITLKKMQQSE